MTTVDTLRRVVEHAERWGIGPKMKQFQASGVRIGLAVPDKDLDLFVQWARHLDDLEITGLVPGPIGALKVRGRLMSGHVIEVSVLLDGNDMRTRDLVGALVLGQVEQYARKLATA